MKNSHPQHPMAAFVASDHLDAIVTGNLTPWVLNFVEMFYWTSETNSWIHTKNIIGIFFLFFLGCKIDSICSWNIVFRNRNSSEVCFLWNIIINNCINFQFVTEWYQPRWRHGWCWSPGARISRVRQHIRNEALRGRHRPQENIIFPRAGLVA